MARSDRYGQIEESEKAYNKIRKKSKKKKKRGCLKALIMLIIIVGLICCAIGGIYAAITISQAPAINPKTMYESLNLSTYIYDNKDKVIESVYYDENRRICHYEDLPENLKNAFIAIEDKTFWKHHGFNFKRMGGAVLQSVTSGGISGTSTITQQLARNVYLADIKSERSIKRKIIEMYYAYVIERELSKEEILESYLNTIYLGYGCYGVTSASKTYFGVDIGDLSLEQCAALAALPQAPDTYALIKSEKDEYCTKVKKGIYANDISRDRRELCLDLMADQEFISENEADAAKKPLVDFIKPGVSTASNTSTSYFKDYVIDQVAKDLMNEYGKSEQEALNMIYTKGLKIHSTLDSKIQKVVAKELKKDSNFPNTAKGKKPEAAMVVVSVKNGAIRAMAGGRKPDGEQLYNRATATRQPGSSIKPLAVYGAALQKSFELAEKGHRWDYVNYGYDKQGTSGYGSYITASSRVNDEKMVVNGKVWPYNSNGAFTGKNTFRTAIQQSINTCAVKIQLQVGNQYSADMVQRFGISLLVTDTSKAANDMNAASLALGGLTYGVSPLEMALAYSVFPNGGKLNEGHCYTYVEDRDGKVLLEHKNTAKEVLDPGVAWIMTDVLKSVVSRGIAGGASLSGIQSGGKTGTTQDQFDIWFDGFTPRYAASLWIGTDQNVPLTTMSGPAASLWGKIMNQIPKVKKGKYKSMPSDVVKLGGEYYTMGTQPGYGENELPESDTRTDKPDEPTKKKDEKSDKKDKKSNIKEKVKKDVKKAKK
ncbi:MAG: transglycosylase domain-containing protein [Clostridiales bacterium]|nr:transglycosylase domain-containing protein [Candidatus Crickella equi]